MEIIAGGIYQHFKNKKFYKVIGVGKNSETMEDVVIYEPQYESEVKFWVRPIKMFCEELEHEGIKQPRFKFIK
ncbi:MAG: DUF1653 domain-containing protein [Candidatus Paceibacterota bacterium]